MSVEITFREDARRKLMAGMEQLAGVIAAALGPTGRSAVVQTAAGLLITSSPAAIAKDFALEDPMENMGAQLIREAVAKTEDLVGGGAASSAVLTRCMVREGFRNIAAGANPVELRKGLQGAAQAASAAIKRIAKPADSRTVVADAASVSAGDPAIGALVAEALERVGRDGAVTVEESGGRDAVLHVEEGVQFERGLLSPHMATDRERMTAELKNPYILVTDKKITSVQDLIPILEQVREQSRSLLIIADSVEGEALGMLAVNVRNGALRAAAVAAPAYGDGRRARLEDLAVLTGGELISEELGRSLQDVTTNMLGTAAFVRVDRKTTVITRGGGNREAVAEWAAGLRARLSNTDYDFDRRQLEERLSKITGSAAAIRVGAATEVELKEKKRRIEAALRIARAAQAEGVVPGGGAALVNIAPTVRACADALSGDRRTGAMIVLGALEAPARQIAENSGFDPGAALAEIRRRGSGTGLDVRTGEYADMLAAGIADPARAVRFALLHAASTAAVLLTSEAGVAGIPPVRQ